MSGLPGSEVRTLNRNPLAQSRRLTASSATEFRFRTALMMRDVTACCLTERTPEFISVAGGIVPALTRLGN